MSRFEPSFSYVLIYVFSIADDAHKGCLKVGKATVKLKPEELADAMRPNSNILNVAAKKRIDSYTKTAGIQYTLRHTEIALRDNGKGGLDNFMDYDVHAVLLNSGIKRRRFQNKGGREWFETNLDTIINAIDAVKHQRRSLSSGEIVSDHDTIEFRPEQLEAIDKTVKCFKNSKKMLWNAKMRFGKTLSALEVVRQLKYRKTIIITHRPVVKEGWKEDFGKIFGSKDGYYFSAKETGNDISQLEDCLIRDVPFIHFASIQDLRGSAMVGGNFDKNDAIFKTNWDLVIIDEAHEGTLTSLGDEVKKAIIKNDTYGKTRVLELSGTPFNLLDDFDEDEIYTWDYVMEQRAKYEWDANNALDSNPYESLPKLEIYTYNLGEQIKGFVETEDNAFNFAEFFRTWTGKMKNDHRQMPEGVKPGDFVHEGEVKSFINLLCKSDDDSNYPFSRAEYRDYFRHTLWMLPGVKEAQAFSKLLKKHEVFGQFEIVNVAGDGDEEEPSSDALQKVKRAIGDDPDKTWTITLSCGKLTTGVSVKPWTAVMMLAGTYSTSASSYLQTIFRVQTPANINGRMKDRCYVFDFAPDRTLKMVAEAGKLGIRPGETQSRVNMGAFLNFCPVIAIDGSEMKPYDVDNMLQQLKRAYANKVVESGFSDTRLYNDELLKLDDMDIKEFENLKDIVSKNKANDIDKDIVINNQGLTDEEREKFEEIQKKKKKKEPLSEEDKKRLEQLKKAKEERGKAIKILRAISIRIPMLIYGMEGDFNKDITIDSFVDNVDDPSWQEFMPQGVTKAVFNKFKKYYDRDIFIAAGKQIRAKLKGADALEPTERVKRIAEIFSSFKNPDKETVLTPWRVVNMHMSDTLGGYDFYDENHKEMLDKEPRFVYQGKVTDNTVANIDAKILEINSKSGLYPLYVTYSIFKKRLEAYSEDEQTEELLERLWKKTVQENIFVICKTPMAKSITKRTLLGYSEGKMNAHSFKDLIGQFKNQPKDVISKISKESYWKKGDRIMKFDAIVGNPPYQMMDGGSKASSTPIYQYFVENAAKMSPNYISMIIKANWYSGGKGLDEFRDYMIPCKSISKIVDFFDHRECFPTADISGGICYFLWDKQKIADDCLIETHRGNKINVAVRPLKTKGCDTFIRFNEAIGIIEKVQASDFHSFADHVSSRKPFGIDTNPIMSKEGKEKIKIFAYPEDGYIELSKLRAGFEILDKIKVCISYAYGERGDFPYLVIGKPFIAPANSCCSETYIVVYTTDSEVYANNVISYMKTKFFRLLVLLKKNTQHATKMVYSFVPDQDFSKPWTDEELYKKYKLTDEEINFIESMIRPM